jgi:hypothetical protein
VIGNGTKQGFLADVQSAPALSPLEQWRQTAFGSPADSGAGADAADPDHDGLPNLIEYALGTDPRQPDAASPLTFGLAGDHLVMSFHRIADPSLTYAVEATDSLVPAGWSPIWSSTGANNTAGLVEVTDPLATGGATTRFLRLSVKH